MPTGGIIDKPAAWPVTHGGTTTAILTMTSITGLAGGSVIVAEGTTVDLANPDETVSPSKEIAQEVGLYMALAWTGGNPGTGVPLGVDAFAIWASTNTPTLGQAGFASQQFRLQRVGVLRQNDYDTLSIPTGSIKSHGSITFPVKQRYLKLHYALTQYDTGPTQWTVGARFTRFFARKTT